MKLSLFLIFMALLFSQQEGNGHFIKTDEAVDKNFKYYSPLMLNFNAGYFFHQSVEIPEIDYKDGLALSFDLDTYIFQGLYFLTSVTYSKTEEKYNEISFLTESGVVLIPEETEKYTYLSPFLGLKYYFRTEKHFDTPWFFSFGLGKNYFIGKNEFDRFSALFELGKITNFKASNSKLYFSLSAHMFEAKGFRPYLLQNGYVYNDIDFKSYVSIKLNIGVHFDLLTNSIRF